MTLKINCQVIGLDYIFFGENSNGKNSEVRGPLEAHCKSYRLGRMCHTGEKNLHKYKISKRKEGKDNLKVTLSALTIPAISYFLHEYFF